LNRFFELVFLEAHGQNKFYFLEAHGQNKFDFFK